MKTNLYLTEKLNHEEKMAIQALKVAVEKQGVAHKLDLVYLDSDQPTKHALLWQNQQLAGYAWLSAFDPQEPEVTVMLLKPEEDFQPFLAFLQTYIKEQQMKETTLIVDHQNQMLTTAVEKAHWTFSFSEAYMELCLDKFAQTPKYSLPLSKGSKAEAAEIGRLMNEGQDYKISSADLERILVYKEADDLVACLRVDESEGRFGIYGFVVKPERRGEGIGRKVLSATLQEILKSEPKEVYLEVETNNQNAFHLYRSLGFKEKVQFDYYQLHQN